MEYDEEERKVLTESAIIIEAGEGKEDRQLTGSYAAKRRNEPKRKQRQRLKNFMLRRTFGKQAQTDDGSEDDPFGLN